MSRAGAWQARDADISALSYRSDQAGPAPCSSACPGFVRDGHDFAPDAVARGASALCVERLLDLPVPQVRGPLGAVGDGPGGLGLLRPSQRAPADGGHHRHQRQDHLGLPAGPSARPRRLRARVSWARWSDASAGRRCRRGGRLPRRSTSSATSRRWWQAGDKAAVMEVSSHALDLGRARGIDFRAVAFTNLTQDHLDYHKTLEDYFAAKCRLFLDDEFAAGGASAAINVDDPFGLRLATACDRRGSSASPPPATPARGARRSGDERLHHDPGRHPGDARSCGAPLWRWPRRGGLASGRPPVEIRRAVSTRLVGAFNVANTLTALGLRAGAGTRPRRHAGRSERFHGGAGPHGDRSTPARTSPCWSTTPTLPTRSATC